MRTVGKLIVDSLVANGIDRLFCVPGESYLGLLDALYGRDDIDTVVCRHEAGAGFMALADARLTGRPGVACVSRGPGACNAAIAVHTAEQDAVPLILIVGQVATADLRRDAFQEIDYGHMFGRIAKWTAEVTHPDRMAETLLRAFRVATGGTPGPVVIAVPEDMLTAETFAETVRPQPPLRAEPDRRDVATLHRWLLGAERPLVIAGSNLDSEAGRAALRRFVEAWNLPLAVAFRRHDLFPNDHPLYVGDLGLSNPKSQMQAMGGADLLIVLGARLSDITTQNYGYPDLVRPQMRLVHIHPDPAAIGTHFAADLGIACNAVAALEAVGVAALLPGREGWIARLREERRKIALNRLPEPDDGIAFERVVESVAASLPQDAIVTLDAGSFAAPAYRIVPFRPPQRLLALISGAMGFGVPAGVAAGLRRPGECVICFVGDGGFLMTGSELAVAMERQLALKVIVAENGIYGSIRIHQETNYPGRNVGTSFTNPDFDLIGRAYGFDVTRILTANDLARLPEILERPGPQLVVVDTSVKVVLPL